MKVKPIKKIFFFIFSLLLFSACEKEHYFMYNIYVENMTKSEYLVYLDFKSFHNDMINKLNIIPAEAPKQIIDTYLVNNTISYYGEARFYAWIYNRSDSTFVKIDQVDLNKPSCQYGRVETAKTKQNLPTLIENLYITINDSLVSKMTKNTHLTDSVFGLKK